MAINRKTVTAAIVAMVLGVMIFTFLNNGNDTQAERTLSPTEIGFTQDPIQFEDFTFQLIWSEYKDNRYIFYYEITNTSNSEINTKKASFKLKNGDKEYSVNSDRVAMGELNPGMKTSGIVDFIMNKEDLEQGSPMMSVFYGFFSGEGYEFPLTKAAK